MRREIKIGLLQDKPEAKGSKSLSTDLKQLSFESLLARQDTLLREMSTEFIHMKKRLRENESRLGVAERRLAQLVRGTKGRIDKFQTGLKILTDRMQKQGQEVKSSLSVLAGRLRERNVNDSKTNQLLEKHNQVVQNFEARVRQMQKLTSDQEFKILNYQATLNQTRKELETLKGF